MTEQEKNNWIKALILGVIIMSLVASFNLYSLKQVEKQVINFAKQVQERESDSCWLWIIDSEGFGISGKTHFNCNKEDKNIGFKTTCESDFFDLNCKWINGSAKGCRCYG